MSYFYVHRGWLSRRDRGIDRLDWICIVCGRVFDYVGRYFMSNGVSVGRVYESKDALVCTTRDCIAWIILCAILDIIVCFGPHLLGSGSTYYCKNSMYLSVVNLIYFYRLSYRCCCSNALIFCCIVPTTISKFERLVSINSCNESVFVCKNATFRSKNALASFTSFST